MVIKYARSIHNPTIGRGLICRETYFDVADSCLEDFYFQMLFIPGLLDRVFYHPEIRMAYSIKYTINVLISEFGFVVIIHIKGVYGTGTFPLVNIFRTGRALSLRFHKQYDLVNRI